MTREKQTAGKPATPARPAQADDLSNEISAAVERQAGDTVKCRRIDGENYRCNWWAAQSTGSYDNPGMFGMLVTTHRVRKSRFLRASRSSTGGLVIRVIGDRAL